MSSYIYIILVMNEYLTNNFLFFSITPKIDFHVKKMSALLQQVKGGGQGQAISKSEVAAAADNILGPLMDLLDGGNIVLSEKLKHNRYFFRIAFYVR